METLGGTFKYAPLNPEANEIRLLELMPVAYDTQLTIIVRKVALVPPPVRSARDKLQASLPADWRVRECLDGRFVFERMRDYKPDEAYETTWLHPVTGLDPNARQHDPHSAFEPQYEALSYVWAPAGNEETINIIDKAGDIQPKTLTIRRNLGHALRGLRLQSEKRIVWVDALCIDQENLAERSDQVAKMGQIYRMARNVMVWFGLAGQNSHLAFKALQYLGQQLLVTEGGAWTTSRPGAERPELALPAVELPFDEETWQAIADLVKRSWFERLWVWQEVRLADDRSFVQCGEDSMSLAHFQRSIYCISSKKFLPSAELRGLILDAVEIMLPYSAQPFFREVQALSWKGCADPRDKIYGVLGAAPESITSRIKPRYDVAAKEVYRDFSLVLLETTHRLDFLDRCDLGARQITGPTWIPDFSVAIDRYVRLPFADLFYAAGFSMSRQPEDSYRGDVLSVAGVSQGVVTFIGDKAPTTADGLLSTVKSWEPDDIYTGTYVTSEPLLNAYVTLLGLGYFIERWPQVISLLPLAEACALYKATFSDIAAADNHLVTESANFIRARNRYFLRSDTGYIGMTFAKPEPGDVLVVLLGCASPVLLRGNESEGYRVVGPAFIHGLMDTEGLIGSFPNSWRARMGSDHGFFQFMHFYNAETGQTTEYDPRLPEDPPEWERLPLVRTSDDPWNVARYRNRNTGVVINADPRMSEEALKLRGTAVVDFKLI